MTNDIRIALRALGKSPFLTAALVVSLGIGTGANAAVFNFISAILLRPPAGIDAASSLVIVRALQSTAGDAGLASHEDLAALRSSGLFHAVSAYDDSVVTGVMFDGTMRQARVASVTGDLFGTLGMEASQGRPLNPGDASGDWKLRPAVISYHLWTALGQPADILNKKITIDRTELAIAGVGPERFRGLHPGKTTDVWRLLGEPANESERLARSLAVVGRTRDRDRAAERLAGRFTVLRYSFMDPGAASETALLAAVLTGATLLVLICACVNAAGLLLSRGNARRSDLAVKLALGAGRARLVRQMLVESTIVGIAGGCAGLLFAYWTTTIVPSLFAPEHVEMLDAGLTPGIVIATLAGSTLLGAALGVLPAMYGTAPVTSLDLRGDAGSISQTGSASRIQSGLVVTQIALSTVLLVSSLLLHRSLGQALEGDLGAGARNVAVATISEPQFSFNPVAGQRDYAQIVSRVRKMRGVTHAGFAAALPIGASNRGSFSVETQPGILERIETDTNTVSLTYFEAMQTPLIEGRFFTAADGGLAPPVAIVNDIAMRRFFGDSAIGRKLIDSRGDTIEIVGVVPSGRYRTMQASPEPMVYRPLSQEYLPRMFLVVRATAPPASELYRLLRPAMQVGRMQVHRITSLEQHFAEALVLDRFVTTLVTACGLMALVLAIAGAYSLMLDSVQRRTREIGLRVALGATALRIARSIFGYGWGLTAIGVAAGLALTLAAERAARSFVFGLPPVDLVVIAASASALMLVVTLAAILPARRAVRVSPTVALRHT